MKVLHAATALSLSAIATHASAQAIQPQASSAPAADCSKQQAACSVATLLEPPAIAVVHGTYDLSKSTSDGSFSSQVDLGGKVVNVLSDGTKAVSQALTSGVGQQVTGMSAAEAAALRANAEAGSKVLGPVSEVANFAVEANKAKKAYDAGQIGDLITHVSTAVAGAAANAFPGCEGRGSACANLAIGVANTVLDDPEMAAARANTINNPDGPFELEERRAEARDAQNDAMDNAARAVTYRKNGGTQIESALRDTLRDVLSPSAQQQSADYASGDDASAGANEAVEGAVDSAVAQSIETTSVPIENSQLSTQLSEYTEQAISDVNSASQESAEAAVDGTVAMQTYQAGTAPVAIGRSSAFSGQPIKTATPRIPHGPSSPPCHPTDAKSWCGVQ